MSEYDKPLPYIHQEIRFYWEKAKKHELWIQRCKDCEQFYFYPRSICPHCFSYNIDWSRVSGKGKIYSFTVTHRPTVFGFGSDVPYNLALVQLDEGVRMMTNIVECRDSDLRIDMPVEVVFDDVTPEVSLPKFRPADPAIRKRDTSNK